MRRVVSALGVVPVVGVLLLALAGGAAAAPGWVYVQGPDGQFQVVENPAPRKCHKAFGEGTTVTNRSHGTLMLFPDDNCEVEGY